MKLKWGFNSQPPLRTPLEPGSDVGLIPVTNEQ